MRVQVPARPLPWCVATSKTPEPQSPHVCTELSPNTLSEESVSVCGNCNEPFKWMEVFFTFPTISVCTLLPLQVHLRW